MKLYHGSSVPGLTTLTPRLSRHDQPYVYFSHDPVLALIYAHPNKCWYTYYYDKDNKLHYDEYFPDQFPLLYQGVPGYVYTCEAEFPRLEKLPWVRLSTEPVSVTLHRAVPDLHAALTEAIAAGDLILHRWADQTDAQREANRRMTFREIEEHCLLDAPEGQYARFIRQYMPDCWEEAQRKLP